ncbi:MAG: ATP-dependent DNA helicase [Nanoarchaeota archaeon]|nr:ATP-dependent DNA helicase [Nanoarchaeota archaeon]
MDDTLFPHEEKREIQDKFLQDTVRFLNNGKNFLAHAPTGMGKTTILGPALFYGLRKKKTVFFLTPMHTQHKIAIDTLKLIKKKHNMDILAVDFIGKRWMCQQPGVQAMGSSEFAEYCSDLLEKKGCDYYSKIKTKGKLSFEAREILKKLKFLNPLGVEQVCKICGEAKLCPYEMSCVLARKADVIICDYFHVLSPSVRDNLFKKIDKDLSETVLIFDEGHNLPSKTRDLLTADLSTFTLDASIRECKKMEYEDTSKKIKKIKNVLELFVQKKTTIDKHEALMLKDEFKKEVEKISNYKTFILNLNQIGDQALELKKKSSTKSVASFLKSWLGPDEGFARILRKAFSKKGKAYLSLSYRCLDPSMILKPIAEEAQIIAMSGTLTPVQMYKDLFGFDAEAKEYSDPFPKQNRLNIIVPKTTTKFTQRDPEMWQKIAVVTSKIVNSIPGNSAVFFPSYYVRDMVAEYFQGMCEKTIFVEHSKLSKEERDEMLEKYKSYKDHGAVLLGCSAGSFGEGIDLQGDYLKSVVVVGLPLGKPDLETKELIGYYDVRFGKGWDYGYVFPAMIRTIQNAGRCIRSEEDKGVIVFLDERYVWQNYSKCFPKDWQIKTTRMPIGLIEDFFKG